MDEFARLAEACAAIGLELRVRSSRIQPRFTLELADGAGSHPPQLHLVLRKDGKARVRPLDCDHRSRRLLLEIRENTVRPGADGSVWMPAVLVHQYLIDASDDAWRMARLAAGPPAATVDEALVRRQRAPHARKA